MRDFIGAKTGSNLNLRITEILELVAYCFI